MPTINFKIRAIIPKEILNDAQVRRNIEHTMTQKTGPDLRREFDKTHRSWDHHPNFKQEHYFGVRVLWVKVFTYSQIYRMVNSGTKPHPIFPKRPGGMLRFRNGYKAKTRPRLIGSVTGGKFGEYKSHLAVNHPGIKEPREFDKTIAEEYEETFLEDVQKAIKDALP